MIKKFYVEINIEFMKEVKESQLNIHLILNYNCLLKVGFTPFN